MFDRPVRPWVVSNQERGCDAMTNSLPQNNSNSPQPGASGSAAQNLADSMWAMLNVASSNLPLEVTQDLALKMVSVLAEVNGNSKSGLVPSVPQKQAQQGSVNPVAPAAELPVTVSGAESNPRPYAQRPASEYWEELPEIVSESKSSVGSKPNVGSSQASKNAPSVPTQPSGEYWNELPTFVSESQLPKSDSGIRSSGGGGGSYLSRAISQRATPPAPVSNSGEYQFRESDTMAGLSGDTAIAPNRSNPGVSPASSPKVPLKPPPLKLPPVPTGPVGGSVESRTGSGSGMRGPSLQERLESQSRSGSGKRGGSGSSPGLGELGLGTPEAGGNASLRDDEVKEKVEFALEATMIPSFSKIKIIVMDGDVVLKGELDSDYEKRLAIQTVKRVAGVKKVNDALKTPDAEEELSAVRAPSRKGAAPKKKIQKKAQLDDDENGWILRHRKHLSAAAVVLVLLGYNFWPRGNPGDPLTNKLVPITGKVEFADQALAGANITFFAMRSEREFDSPVMTTSMQDGVFKLGNQGNKMGLLPGKYAVVVQYQTMTVTADGEAEFGPNILPKAYSKPETSPLTIEVAENKSEVGTLKIREVVEGEEMNPEPSVGS